jgi:hypothetical protein
MMSSIVSSTFWMKQALPCGYSYCVARVRLRRSRDCKNNSRARAFADAVLMIQPDVEPDRRIERAVLVQAQPGQFVVKSFRRFRIAK